VIYRAFGRLPQRFLQSPPWGHIIFNLVKQFRSSFALSPSFAMMRRALAPHFLYKGTRAVELILLERFSHPHMG
jgi:hypothetical protein